MGLTVESPKGLWYDRFETNTIRSATAVQTSGGQNRRPKKRKNKNMCQSYEESYGVFASVYDLFMDQIDYDAWCGYVRRLLIDEGISRGLVAELGCGTGNLTERLAAAGYEMIGIDASEEMLLKAAEKRIRSGQEILYLQQDMREMELYGTVQAVVSVCDSMNYITDPQDMTQVFSLVNNYLDPGGVFIFDLNTLYKYETLLGERTIAENREEGSFIWENTYDPVTQLNEYALALFLPRADGLYEKHEEYHCQRGYSLSEIQELLAAGGLEFVAAYDAFTKDPPKADSERIYILAREKGKRKENV